MCTQSRQHTRISRDTASAVAFRWTPVRESRATLEERRDSTRDRGAKPTSSSLDVCPASHERRSLRRATLRLVTAHSHESHRARSRHMWPRRPGQRGLRTSPLTTRGARAQARGVLMPQQPSVWGVIVRMLVRLTHTQLLDPASWRAPRPRRREMIRRRGRRARPPGPDRSPRGRTAFPVQRSRRCHGGKVHLRQERPIARIRPEWVQERIAQDRNDEGIAHVDRSIHPLECTVDFAKA